MGAPTLQSLATYAEAFSDRELALPRHDQLRCRSGNFSRLMWRGSDREFGRGKRKREARRYGLLCPLQDRDQAHGAKRFLV